MIAAITMRYMGLSRAGWLAGTFIPLGGCRLVGLDLCVIVYSPSQVVNSCTDDRAAALPDAAEAAGPRPCPSSLRRSYTQVMSHESAVCATPRRAAFIPCVSPGCLGRGSLLAVPCQSLLLLHTLATLAVLLSSIVAKRAALRILQL